MCTVLQLVVVPLAVDDQITQCGLYMVKCWADWPPPSDTHTLHQCSLVVISHKAQFREGDLGNICLVAAPAPACDH